MKRTVIIVPLLLSAIAAGAQNTLRIDYEFAGTADEAVISVAQVRSVTGWAGRRVNTGSVPLRGNGSITMSDAKSGKVLYCNSFSTLFQEWQNTEEATRVRKSFENVFLLPMPEKPATVQVELYDSYGRTAASLTHPVDPADILIRPAVSGAPVTDLHIGGSTADCIDVAIVAEGYTAVQMEEFRSHARAAVESILSHEPFKSLADRFNFRAVELESADSGVSVPRKGLWLSTPLSSHFDTFYSDRYLTTLHLRDLHDRLAGVPYETIIILANTDTYGGGGIYNSYTLTASRNALFRPVVVHEFGHSFAGLADEYFYDDQYSDYYHPDVEPWEPNITTKADFSSKWEDMTGRDGVGLFEGGGYMSKGVWRACRNCRMRTNEAASFCPVCRRAIERMIRFLTEESEREGQ